MRRSYTARGGLSSPKSGRVRSVPMVPDVVRALAALATREWFTVGRRPCLPRPDRRAPGRRRAAVPGEFAWVELMVADTLTMTAPTATSAHRDSIRTLPATALDYRKWMPSSLLTVLTTFSGHIDGVRP